MILTFPDRIPAKRKKRTMIPSRNRLPKRSHFLGLVQKMQVIKLSWPRIPARIRGWVNATDFFVARQKTQAPFQK